MGQIKEPDLAEIHLFVRTLKNGQLTFRHLSNYRIMMNTTKVIDALGALAHEHRLRAYRLLVEQGPGGLNAGTIAERLEMAPSSLTFHLQHLHRAGLISQRRDSRQLIYAADFSAMNILMSYLTKNCCGSGSAGCEPARTPSRRVAKRRKTQPITS